MKILICLSGLALIAGDVLGQGQPAPQIPTVRQVETIQKPNFAITNDSSGGEGVIAYNSSGRYLAVAGGKTIRVYKVESRNESAVNLMCTLNDHAAQILGLAFSDTNTLVSVSLDQTAKIWDVATGKMLHSTDVKVAEQLQFALAPGQKSLAADSAFGEARLWNYQTGEILQTFEPGDSLANTVAFTPDGKSLVIGTEKGVLRVMDVGTWTVARIVDLDSPIVSLAVSAERIVLGYNDGAVAMLNFGEQAFVPEAKKHSGAVNALAFSPSGKRFASASADHVVKVWDSVSLKPLASLEGHRASVTAVVFSPDGQRIVSLDADGIVDFWTLPKE